MKPVQCRQCHFWVDARDKHCPNCGIASPAISQKTVEWYANQHLIALVIGCGSLAIGMSIIRAIGAFSGYFLGGLVMLISLAYYGFVLWKTRQFGQTSPNSLHRSETLVQERLRELATRQTRIYDMLQGNDPEKTFSSHPLPLLETLQQALTTLQVQQDHYRAKLWEIALLRWQNRLKPLIEDWQSLTYEQCQIYLNMLTEMEVNGQALLHEYKTLSRATAAEKESLARWEQTLEKIQEMRQALQAKQIAVTVKGISRFDNEIPIVFNDLADAWEFSASLQELEEEYFRLKSEAEIYAESKEQTSDSL